jgi:hypothetical protein
VPHVYAYDRVDLARAYGFTQARDRYFEMELARRLGRGTVSDLALQAHELLRIRSEVEDVLSLHPGQSVERLRVDTDRDKIFTASEAVGYGLADAIITDRVLLDVRGKLEDRAETRTAKPTPPPEPLEMIFLRPDGTFEVASSADSQKDIERYQFTLSTDDAGAAAGPGQQPPAGESPFGNPFAPKR